MRQRLPVLENVTPVARVRQPVVTVRVTQNDVEVVPGATRVAVPAAEGQRQVFQRQALQIGVAVSSDGVDQFRAGDFRAVPPAVARRGSFIGSGVVLMPSYVNIGAYVDDGTMVDTWATVGSCAQIGKNVHLSGGVGIGGVLEPLQASPTIIEDDCFIGARSEVVEGVVVEEGSVISMGV